MVNEVNLKLKIRKLRNRLNGLNFRRITFLDHVAGRGGWVEVGVAAHVGGHEI